MESFSILMIVGTGIYILYELFQEDENELIARRLLEYSPEKIKTQEEQQKSEEASANAFLKEAINTIAQNVIKKSKNILAHKQILIEANMAADDEAYINFMSKKLIYTGVCGVLGLFLAVTSSVEPIIKLMLIIIFPLIGFRFPDIQAKRIAKQRAYEITYTLPDAIELLTICVEAGLGLDSAITRVATEQIESAPVLSGEFKKVGKDVLAGIPRADALRNFSKRVASPELKSFVGLLIQSDKFGTSIAKSLKIYSDTMRTKRRQKVEELAATASIKMTIPLVLFILPATFVIILSPAALSMMEAFSGGIG